MKKLVICLAIATVAVSCKKIQAGGNKNTLKLEEGAERYSDDPQGEGHEAAAKHTEEATAEKHETEAPKTDSAATAKSAEAEKAPKAEH